MIARAVAGKPRVLLLDEATSALDNRTQDKVSQNLRQLRSTRVVIAHRLTTVMNADRIFMIDNGLLVQSGSYQELSARPGPFAEFVKRQLT
jgi:ATP-binding cassette subfamily C protein